jgi:Subtilase family
VGLACLACEADAPVATQPGRLQPPVLVNQQVSDGCTRFALRVVNGAPVVEALYNTTGCPTDQLKLETDSAPVYDAATGRLRVPLVIRNTGSVAVVAPARIRFVADSAQFLNGQGQVIPGLPDIVAVNYDTANANGRAGQWRYDTLLAASGAPQVLAPGAVSRRRWLEFSGTSWNQIVRIKLPTVGTVVGSVPMIPPDSTPVFARDPAHIISNPPGGGFAFVRDLLEVEFTPASTAADRANAVAAVVGTVVGGKPRATPSGGVYFIRTPASQPGAEQSSIEHAEQILRQHPAVMRATRYAIIEIRPTYLKPNDGTQWARSNWTLSRDSIWAPRAWRHTWTLSLLRAPMAWGCSTGSPSTVVGVLDYTLPRFGVTDLVPNVGSSYRAGLPGDTARPHGAWVASVLAARGNNGSGMSGVMWTAELALADPTEVRADSSPVYVSGKRHVPLHEFGSAWVWLLGRGARVINVSLGADSTPIFSFSDTSQVRQARESMGYVASISNAAASDPLLVISAGNVPGGDPRLSLWPILKDSTTQRVLVVAAMRRDSSLHRAPPGSPYVDVVAPGDSVSALDAGGSQFVSGASFATPLVSGIAGLLLSFDPRLTAAEVRQLIIQGAVASGVTAGGYPVVDAYQSLKLAAQRPGAPLCGNRVFARNDSVYAQRDPANNSSDELLGLVPQAWPALAVEHGGRAITNHLISGTGLNTLVYGSSAWTLQARTPQFPNSGFARSTEGTSHDGDTLVAAIAQTSSAVTWALTDPQLNVVSPSLTVSFGSPFTNMRSGYDPSRPRVLVSLQDPSLSKLWLLDFAAQAVTPLPTTYPGREVDYIGIAEDGEEARLLLRDMGGASVGSCAIHFVSLRSATFGVLQRAITVPKRSNGFCAGDGAVAPRVASELRQPRAVLPGSR